jgi:type IV pilus assembly protein PilX
MIVTVPHQRAGRPAWAVPSLRAQDGIILIVTLIILAAMTLASLAMLNSVDTTTAIAGNVAFKQSATNSADIAIDAAGVFLTVPKQNTEADNPAAGYYATNQDGLDITGNKTPGNQADDIDWDGPGAVTLPKDSAGNTVSYRINRMCDSTGPMNASTCSVDIESGRPYVGSFGISLPTLQYDINGTNSLQNLSTYYRITMRVAGPKNNVSYVQTVVSLKPL